MTSPEINEQALLDALAASPRPNGTRGRFTRDVAAARRKEQTDRSGNALARAMTVMRRLHADEYRFLYEAALAEINAERGPLPGDE